MAVIDLYTRRVLGPREIEARASYQPQAVGEDWSFADDMVDHDLARLLNDSTDAPPAPDHTSGEHSTGKQDTAVERYARWMALGHHERENAEAAFRPDNRHEQPLHNPSKQNRRGLQSNRALYSPDVRAEREKLFQDIEQARLSQTAEDLRSAAQRLRDLANNLRRTRDKLYEHNQRRDRDLRS